MHTHAHVRTQQTNHQDAENTQNIRRIFPGFFRRPRHYEYYQASTADCVSPRKWIVKHIKNKPSRWRTFFLDTRADP